MIISHSTPHIGQTIGENFMPKVGNVTGNEIEINVQKIVNESKSK